LGEGAGLKNSLPAVDKDGIRSPSRFEVRLSRAADSVESALDFWEGRVKARDAIILEAIDAGESRRELARWAHLSPARIAQIVARLAAERSEEGDEGPSQAAFKMAPTPFELSLTKG